MGAKFTEVSLVPSHNVGTANPVQAGEEGEGSQYDGSNNRLPASEDMKKRGGLPQGLVGHTSS